MTAHQLHGGPSHGAVYFTKPGQDHYPAELRLLREEADVLHVDVYGINRGHSADPLRPVRPTYHYTHTTTI